MIDFRRPLYLQRTLAIRREYHCMAGLQFYKCELNCFTTYFFCQRLDLNRGPLVSEATALPTEPHNHYILITTYFPIWSNPILLNWRSNAQWSFSQWRVFSATCVKSHESSGRYGFFVNATDPIRWSGAPSLLILVADCVVHPVRLLGLGDDIIDVCPLAIPELTNH